MEHESYHHEDNESTPKIPDDISGLIDDLHDRADQRRRAIEINLENARDSKTQEERDYWVLKVMEFSDILDEYKDLYPEVFPKNNDS